MLGSVFSIIIIPTLAYNVQFIDVFNCENLLSTVNHTVTSDFKIASLGNLSLSESFIMLNKSCQSLNHVIDSLEEDLCGREMEYNILEQRNKLSKYLIDLRRAKCTHKLKDLEGQYLDLCTKEFKKHVPACKSSGAEMANDEDLPSTANYIWNKTGSVREINLTLEVDHTTGSCCAIIAVQECLKEQFETDCSLINKSSQVMEYYNDTIRFFINAISLFSCDEGACAGKDGLLTEDCWVLALIFVGFLLIIC